MRLLPRSQPVGFYQWHPTRSVGLEGVIQTPPGAACVSEGHLLGQGDGGAILRVEEIAGHEEAGGEEKSVCVGACLQANSFRGQARSHQAPSHK